MEAEPGRQRSRQKHRERALQQQEKQIREGEGTIGQDDHNESPPRSSKDKLPRSKPKKGKCALFEEDIIDGFAILSFKTLEDLEILAKKNACNKDRAKSEEDNNIKDTHSQDKDDNDKTKKKKFKKNSSHNHCTENCSSVISDSNSSNIIPADSAKSSSEIGCCDSSNHINEDHNSDNQSYNVHHHHHLHHHNHHHSTVPLEPPRSISRDRLSDASTHSGSGQGYVCDVESGDDKASESGSELYSGIPVGGILNHITSSNLLPAEALSAPTPPPSTSATPISLCNGIGGPASESPTAGLHVLVVTTTATTTTTTRSTSKSGFSDSVTTSTSTAVSVAAVQPPPSVIHPSPYLPGHQDSKLSQLSPGSFLSQSRSKRSLSPSSQEQVVNNNNHSNFISASSSCARSLQYSKSHKSNHIPNNTKDLPLRFSPNVFGRSDSPQNHPHHIQPPAFNSLLPPRVQNGPHNLSHLSPDLLQPRPGNSFPLNSHSPGAGYPYPPVIRPEPLVNHHSSRTVGETKSDHQLSSSLVSNNGVHATATATSPIIANTGNHHSQQQQHHRSSSSSLGKSNTHHHHHSHQQHGFGGGSRSRSPPGHSSKRPCKSPSGLLLSSSPAVSSSLSSATVPSLSDHYKRFSNPLQTKQQQPSGKSDNVKHSITGSEKDYPEVKSKDSSLSSASHQHGHHHHHHHHHSKEHRDKDKERERDKQRTPVSLSTSLPSTIFQSPNPAWSSTSGPILNPLLPLHQPSSLSSSSALHPLVPHPSQSSVASLFPLPLPSAPPLLAAGAPSLSVGMFAAPIHPAPPSLSSAPPLPAHPAASAESLLRSQDFLHQDLNNRLLAHRDSSTIALPPSPFVRSETHQHQHQHLHNHMHQHTYGGLNAAPLVPPTPPLFDKLPKAFEAGIFRPSIVHSYSAAFSSLLPPGPSGASLASSLQGAFQPKKQGKWCAVHVRVAWEIYHRQQKKLQKDHDGPPGSTSTSSSKSGPDTKPLEPLLRPPSHLFPGSAATTRPPESPLLASVARSLPDGIAHPGSSFLSSAAHLGISSFPRPSPYPVPSLLNPLGFSGLGTSIFAPVHDKVPAGLPSGMSSSPHEWSRLHRAHSTFPSWPKLEVEKERERELRREEEKDRERRGSFSHPHAGMDDIRHKDLDYSRPKSRSRSRSPLRNGRLDHHSKSEVAPYDRRFEDKRSMSTAASLHKLKDERRAEDVPALPLHLVERERLDKERFERDRMERDRLERERIEKDKLLQSAAVAEREKLLQAVEREKLFQTSGYLGLNPFGAALPTHPGLLDRRVGLMASPGAPYPFLERAPVPTSMWSPFDKSAAEFAHRLEMERERERMAMMSRLSSVPSHLAVLEQERLKEQILREQQEREYELRRQYFDRLPAFNADRLRAVDPLAVGSYFPQTISPMFTQAGLASLKSNSPHGMSGAPPPLIPSAGSAVAGTVLPSRSHDNSPSSSSKLKGCSPADSTSDLKDKREDSSTDPDAHSR